MQGHNSSVSTLPENMSFDHGSTSDPGMDSQMSWNSIQTPSQHWLPAYRISSSTTNVQSLHHPGHSGQSGEWSLGEPSSRTAQSLHRLDENQKENAWSIHSQGDLALEGSLGECSNIHSVDSVDGEVNVNQTANGSSLLQISSPDTSADFNLHSQFGDHENDGCQVVQQSNTYLSIVSSNNQIQPTDSSSGSLNPPESGGYATEASEDRPGCSLDGQRISCKRKYEIHAGQSSGAGSSNSFQHTEISQWDPVPADAQITPSRVGVSVQTENELVNESEQANPRLRLGIERAVSASLFSSTARATAESSHRNFRLRINGLPQQDPIPRNSSSTEADVGNADVSSSQGASGAVPQNVSSHDQLILLTRHRNLQSRWGGASSSRTSSSTALTNSRERDDVLFESALRNVPRSISEHPMFFPAIEAGSSSQQPNWIFSGASTSHAGSTSRVDSSAPTWSHRSRGLYTRRISEIVRRSFLSSAGADSGGQTGDHANQLSPSATSQGITISSESGNHVPQSSNSTSALLENLDGDLRMPHLLRNLAAAAEGRSSAMSEIRHVLDLMRRGESLRLEDVMMLDHPAFFGMADIHDRHRDMRLDVDNMSYEELLALEERIGNVCTGLTEETIMSCLKQKKHMDRNSNEDQPDTEPCSICREEYSGGEDLGILECGHDFHTDCIKQWLVHKNLCPICKTTGLST